MPIRPSSLLRYAIGGFPLLASAALAQISFGPSREIIDTISSSLSFVTATDMDGDGDTDILAAERNGVRVLWWQNDGTGTFSKSREWRTGEYHWEVIGIADHNLDGLPDIWIRDEDERPSGPSPWNRRFRVALNDGTGSFLPPVVVLQKSRIWRWEEELIADIDGDSRSDILSGNVLFLADEHGTFTRPEVSTPILRDSLLSEVSLADLDGDGLQDLIVRYRFDPEIWGIRNLGAAGFSEPVRLFQRDPDDTRSLSSFCIRRGSGAADPPRLYLRCWDEDDRQLTLRVFGIAPDLSTAEIASYSLPESTSAPDAETTWHGLTCDPQTGRIYICSYHYDPAKSFSAKGTSTVHEINVTGSGITLSAISSLPGCSDLLPPLMTDLNGDSLPDLLLPLPSLPGVWGSSSDQIVWHPGTPSGGISPKEEVVARSPLNLRIYAVTDVDADGHVDLLLGSAETSTISGHRDKIEVLRNTGTEGKFERIPISHDHTWIDVVAVVDQVGEFHIDSSSGPGFTITCADGRPDFLVQTFDADPSVAFGGELRFEWLLQDEDGNFHLKPLTSDPAFQLTTATYVDWDGDGTADLIYEAQSSPLSMPEVKWRRGIGAEFGSASLLLSADELEPVTSDLFLQRSLNPLIDVDWDGDLDLIYCFHWLHERSPIWFENVGNGVLGPAQTIPRPGLQIIPDVDGDGRADFRDRWQIQLARPGVTFEVRNIPPYFSQWPDEPFLDLDGDGDPDYLRSPSDDIAAGHQTLEWIENRGGADFQSSEALSIAPARWAGREQALTGDLNGDGISDLIIASDSFSRLEWFEASVVPLPPAFSLWIGSHGLGGHSAGPLADRDGDGVLNWDEFAFGSHPGVSDPDHPGRPRILPGPEGLALSFLRRTDAAAAGLTYDVEWSPDLIDWEPWSGDAAAIPAGGNYERVRLPASVSLDREFFRVKITDPSSPKSEKEDWAFRYWVIEDLE